MTCIGVKRPIPKTVYVNVTYRSWTTTDGVDSRNTFWFSSDRFYVDDPDQAFGQYHAEVTNVISADFLRRLSVAKADHSFEMDVSESSLSEELIPSLRWGSLTISLTRDI